MLDPQQLAVLIAEEAAMSWSVPRMARVAKDSVNVSCDHCGARLFVICQGRVDAVLTCHGQQMSPSRARSCAETSGHYLDGMAPGRLYTDSPTGLVARCTKGGPVIAACDGRPLQPADSGRSVPATVPAGNRGSYVAAPPTVGLLLEARRIRWNAVDWACTWARRSGQRTLTVMLDSRLWWCQAETDTIATDGAAIAWAALDESVADAVAERVLGWGIEPVIRPMAWRAPGTGDARPDLLVTPLPGRWSWPSRQLIGQLRRHGWSVALVE